MTASNSILDSSVRVCAGRIPPEGTDVAACGCGIATTVEVDTQ